MGPDGNYRLWLPKAGRHFLKREETGLFIHRDWDFALSNSTMEGHKGFVVPSHQIFDEKGFLVEIAEVEKQEKFSNDGH